MQTGNLSDTNKFLLAVLVIVLVCVGGAYLLTREVPERITEEEAPVTPAEERALEGIYECLPHKNTDGPQTLECAFGIETDDGMHHGLSFSDPASLSSTLQTGSRIRVEGHYVPVEALSSDHWRIYDMRGIMQVESVELL